MEKQESTKSKVGDEAATGSSAAAEKPAATTPTSSSNHSINNQTTSSSTLALAAAKKRKSHTSNNNKSSGSSSNSSKDSSKSSRKSSHHPHHHHHNTGSKHNNKSSGSSSSNSSSSRSHNHNSSNSNSKDNSSSLGEIWFDTMRRNRGDNSTPSSPTNSSEQEGNSTDCSSNNGEEKVVKGNNKETAKTTTTTTTTPPPQRGQLLDTQKVHQQEEEVRHAIRVANSRKNNSPKHSNNKKRRHPDDDDDDDVKKPKTAPGQDKTVEGHNNKDTTKTTPAAAANPNAATKSITTGGYMSDDEGFHDRKNHHHHQHHHHQHKHHNHHNTNTKNANPEGENKDGDNKTLQQQQQQQQQAQSTKPQPNGNGVAAATEEKVSRDYNNYQDDSSGSSRSNLAAVVMAANALLEQHKQQDIKDARNKLQQAKIQRQQQATDSAQQQQQQQQPNPSRQKDQSSGMAQDCSEAQKLMTPTTGGKCDGANCAKNDKNATTEPNCSDGNNNNKRGKKRVNITEPPKVAKRLNRNAREKERSGRINDQFDALKDLLSSNGIVVPKGTKGSILGITLQYIRALQEAQRQKQQDTSALRQQVHAIAQGSMGPEASRALFYSARKQGLELDPSLAPPGAAVTFSQQQQQVAPTKTVSEPEYDPLTKVEEKDYPTVWNQCPAAMAMATLGGTFVDCNQVFCKLLHCTKPELRQLSIFHLLNNNTMDNGNSCPAPDSDNKCSKADLKFAFEQISELLDRVNRKDRTVSGDGSSSLSVSSSSSFSSSSSKSLYAPVLLHGSVQGQEHLGLAISLIRSHITKDNESDAARQHHLCVTITHRPTGENAGDSSNRSKTNRHSLFVPASLENAAEQTVTERPSSSTATSSIIDKHNALGEAVVTTAPHLAVG